MICVIQRHTAAVHASFSSDPVVAQMVCRGNNKVMFWAKGVVYLWKHIVSVQGQLQWLYRKHNIVFFC